MMKKKEDLIDQDLKKEGIESEVNLRPLKLTQFIGQKNVKDNLIIFYYMVHLVWGRQR